MEAEKTPPTDTSGGRGRTALVVVGVLGAVAVNIAAFVLSAAAITAVADAAGINKAIAWAMVPSVDGLMVTGTVVFISNKLRGRSVRYPLAVLGSGVLLSVICNAFHAQASGGHIVQLGGGAKAAISAIPAISLALSFHLVADMVKDSLGLAEGAVETSAPASDRRPDSVRPDASETSAQTSAVASAGRVSERLPDATQTPSEASAQTRDKASAKTSSKPRQTSKKKTGPKLSLREQIRPILIENPEMNAADVARRLDREPTGHIRTTCNSVLSELIESGEIKAPPLRIAQ